MDYWTNEAENINLSNISSKQRKTYTITGKTDGFGAQYQAIMSGIVFCEYKNYEYIHTPISTLEHLQSTKKLNKFIGIPAGRELQDNTILKEYSQEVHGSPNPSIYYTPKVLEKIRGFYYSTSKPSKSEYDIAIHIRRGNVSRSNKRGTVNRFNKFVIRYTSNKAYLKIIKLLKAKYPAYSICIYSEGKIDDFKQLALDNVYFCLNKDIEQTFHDLVTAKVLVTAKSSLSYAAALLSVNTIYYIPFWHKPLSHWIIVEEYDTADKIVNYCNILIKGNAIVNKFFTFAVRVRRKMVRETIQIYGSIVTFLKSRFYRLD